MLGTVSHLAELEDLFHLFLLAFAVQVDDGVFLHTVEVSGNVDPYEHPGNFFDEGVVLTSELSSPFFGLGAIFENVLWICIPPLGVPSCLFLTVVSQVR